MAEPRVNLVLVAPTHTKHEVGQADLAWLHQRRENLIRTETSKKRTVLKDLLGVIMPVRTPENTNMHSFYKIINEMLFEEQGTYREV